MNRYIAKLISQGENQHQDFKFEISDARKIARTLVAFSNAEGGKLLIGVKDNGNIAGIQSEEEYYMIEGAAQMYCRPTVMFTCKRWEISGKTILEVDVPKAQKKPYLAQTREGKWLAYIRVNDQNLLANKVLLDVWKKEQSSKGICLKYSDTEKILLEFLEKNDRITLSRFCKISRISRRKAEVILVNLILFGIIDIIFTEKLTYYTLKSEFRKQQEQ